RALALLNQLPIRSSDRLGRHAGVDTVLVEQIDNIGPKSLERSFSDLFDVRWPAVHANWRTAVWIEFEPKLGGDHHLLAEWSERFAHEFFVRERAVRFGSVEECDAAFRRCAK